MLKNNLLLAWRNLLRNKLHTVINIVGLAIGISACLAIYRIVSFELSFNEWIPEKENIYRVYTTYSGSFSGTNRGIATAAYPHIRDTFTGLEAATHFFTYSTKVKTPNADGTENDHGSQQKLIFARPSYFEVLKTHQWLVGKPEDALSKPYQVALTEQKVKQYFGEIDIAEAIGRDLIYRDSLTLQVAGVISDPGATSDFGFTDFISFSTLENSWLKDEYELDTWTSTTSSSQLWVKLASATAASDISEQLPALSKEYESRSTTTDSHADFMLQELSDLHFNSEVGIFDNSRSAAHLPTLNILIVLALFLLTIAAINFINLETAQAMRRAKEVGVRKVLGSSRLRLVGRFLTESYLVTIAGVGGGILMAYYSFIYFEEFIPADLTLGIAEANFWIFVILVTTVVGFLAGLYPAIILASFKPVDTFKSQHQVTNSAGAFLRKGLTIFQFSFSQILIAGSFVMIWQISFMLEKDLGFQKDGIVYIYTPWYGLESKKEVLKNELNQISGITDMTQMDAAPVRNGWSTTVVTYKTADGEVTNSVEQKSGDANYLSFFDMEIIAGRPPQESQENEIVINDTYRKALGFQTPEEAIDIEVSWNQMTSTVVGVISDFHFRSLHNEIDPLLIAYKPDQSGIALKLSTSDMTGDGLEQTLEEIRTAYTTVYPDYKANVWFLDETTENFYKTERKSSKLAWAATFVAILISCLGLFGLASYSIQQRTKELGIRKVLGATMTNIMRLLSFNFIRLVLIAFIIAGPAAYFLADIWLQDFAYRVSLAWWIFASTVGVSIMVAVFSIGYQATKAAVANPADSLRYE